MPGPLQSAESSRETEFFEKRIRPILADHCLECHSEEKKVKGGLRLDSRDGWQKGGDSGPALVPGEPDKSLLIETVRFGNEDLQMPPKRRLSDAQIADLVEWVRMGAPDPRDDSAMQATRAAGMSVEEGRSFWSYQPPRRPAPPAVKDTRWPRNEIDRYVLVELEARGSRPVRDADPATLIRRAYFDLVGLPPSPEEIDAYARAASPDGFAKVVDRLLASPHFGE
ncbi:MAG TPA: DUF1549 domain-containing protein, partial [Verrucomicrobiae bacterium]|nr:DUF1549 domain-containing protein [Verrucomicrobiae bacterium]